MKQESFGVGRSTRHINVGPSYGQRAMRTIVGLFGGRTTGFTGEGGVALGRALAPNFRSELCTSADPRYSHHQHREVT